MLTHRHRRVSCLDYPSEMFSMAWLSYLSLNIPETEVITIVQAQRPTPLTKPRPPWLSTNCPHDYFLLVTLVLTARRTFYIAIVENQPYGVGSIQMIDRLEPSRSRRTRIGFFCLFSPPSAASLFPKLASTSTPGSNGSGGGAGGSRIGPQVPTAAQNAAPAAAIAAPPSLHTSDHLSRW